MKIGKYRFVVVADSRGRCDMCWSGNTLEKQSGILIRLHAPFKAELRICYACLIDYILRIKKRKERNGKLLHGLLANLEGKAAAPPKTDG